MNACCPRKILKVLDNNRNGYGIYLFLNDQKIRSYLNLKRLQDPR